MEICNRRELATHKVTISGDCCYRFRCNTQLNFIYVFWLNRDVFLNLTQVSKPLLDNVLNCLKIEVSDITITLSAR